MKLFLVNILIVVIQAYMYAINACIFALPVLFGYIIYNAISNV